jgi:hypothetical protein
MVMSMSLYAPVHQLKTGEAMSVSAIGRWVGVRTGSRDTSIISLVGIRCPETNFCFSVWLDFHTPHRRAAMFFDRF